MGEFFLSRFSYGGIKCVKGCANVCHLKVGIMIKIKIHEQRFSKWKMYTRKVFRVRS